MRSPRGTTLPLGGGDAVLARGTAAPGGNDAEPAAHASHPASRPVSAWPTAKVPAGPSPHPTTVSRQAGTFAALSPKAAKD